MNKVADNLNMLATPAAALLEARGRWTAVKDTFIRNAEPISVKRFWELHPIFFREVVNFLARGRDEVVKHAFDEVCRKVDADSFHQYEQREGVSQNFAIEHYGYDDLVGFMLRWRLMTDDLAEAWDGVPMNRGDDSFNDLCDSLPLMGERIIKRVINKEILSPEQLKDDVRDAPLLVGVTPDIAGFVLDGENYFRMRMEEVFTDRLWYHIVRQIPHDGNHDGWRMD